MAALTIISRSQAADLGYKAVADLVAAAGPDLSGYRIIGGHMVQLLIHAYPADGTIERATADADAGIERVLAAGQGLHESLLQRGYEPSKGNHYVRSDDTGELHVDLLVPHGTVGEPEIIEGRGFDAVPGLSLALSAAPLNIEAEVHLSDGGGLEFSAPIPDAEPALVMKALAWSARRGTSKQTSDLTDIVSLMEIIQVHKDTLTAWGYGQERLAQRGQRLDAARALYDLVGLISQGRIARGSGIQSPARLAALISSHIPRPVSTP